MTHEPGRERHTTHKCEHCGCTAREDELTLTDEDEYWCEGCINNANEATAMTELERLELVLRRVEVYPDLDILTNKELLNAVVHELMLLKKESEG